MGKLRLAVLDTCVIIDAFVADDASEEDLARRELALDTLAELQKTHRLALPTAVIAELGRGDPGPVVEELLASIPSLLILSLDADAATAAGPARLAARASGTSGKDRRFQNYDALIVGTAIANGADVIVTSNESDFGKLVGTHPIEIRNHRGQPQKKGAQLKLMPPSAAAKPVAPKKAPGG